MFLRTLFRLSPSPPLELQRGKHIDKKKKNRLQHPPHEAMRAAVATDVSSLLCSVRSSLGTRAAWRQHTYRPTIFPGASKHAVIYPRNTGDFGGEFQSDSACHKSSPFLVEVTPALHGLEKRVCGAKEALPVVDNPKMVFTSNRVGPFGGEITFSFIWSETL